MIGLVVREWWLAKVRQKTQIPCEELSSGAIGSEPLEGFFVVGAWAI